MPWTNGLDDWFRPIGKLLDARLCIDVEGGIIVKAASIEKYWQLSKYKLKPSQSGEDICYEKYIP